MILTRTEVGEHGAFGTLQVDEDSPPFAVTLEHTYWVNREWQPKIPAGVFHCFRGTHQLEHGPEFTTFEVTGVAGHTGLLLHKGNLEEDSRGCILLGEKRGELENEPAVLASGEAFDKFMKLEEGVDRFELTVR